MSWSGARLLLECLKREAVTTLFGYPGGAVLPIYDALVDVSGLQHVLTRHEQGAVHAADGWARSKREPGVVLATSGPGATNLITGLATAHADSVPLVAITGQVPSQLIGTDAFQETDILGASLPYTRFSAMVRSVEEIPSLVRKAFSHATEGRPGPVLLDVPKDVSSALTDAQPLPPMHKPVDARDPDRRAVRQVANLLRSAKRPVLYVGGGAVASGCTDQLRTFAKRTGIPVTTTLMALGAMPSGDPLFLGMPGMHGTRRANTALAEADVLLVVGARFDDRVTGNASRFSQHSKRIVIDTDKAEFNKICSADLRLNCDAGRAMQSLSDELSHTSFDLRPWMCHLQQQPAKPPVAGVSPNAALRPEDIFAAINRVLPENSIVTTDVGQHQMWAAQLLRHHLPGRFLTSGGLGTMGFGLPAALGARLASPDSTVLAIVGDGGFQMTSQELSTLARYGVGVIVLVIDNKCLGMVRQWQQLFHGRRYSEVDLSDNPDFVAMSESMGVRACVADNVGTLEAALQAAVQANEPCVLHVPIYREQNVFPIVPPGQPATTMMDSE
ncbi:MAG: biosynthetic-type acetolactate synthase large subunit [Planctomycetota bacterium]|jgi:acetolactate synthase-1/2/3 large subunit